MPARARYRGDRSANRSSDSDDSRKGLRNAFHVHASGLHSYTGFGSEMLHKVFKKPSALSEPLAKPTFRRAGSFSTLVSFMKVGNPHADGENTVANTLPHAGEHDAGEPGEPTMDSPYPEASEIILSGEWDKLLNTREVWVTRHVAVTNDVIFLTRGEGKAAKDFVPLKVTRLCAGPVARRASPL
jgi:hypothetical protein